MAQDALTIATWNINGVKARIDTALDWFKTFQPDVACLQEIKSVDEAFPKEGFEALGYNVATHGQKGFNGVALMSKLPLEDVTARLPGDDGDEQARYLEGVVSRNGAAIRIASLYLPNGNPVDSEKYPYKLAWMDRLHAHARALLEREEAFVLAGDYNVIPMPGDVHDPAAWANDALFRLDTRRKFRALAALGLRDAYRQCHTEEGQYSFWDYQAGAWQKNHGIRIDHLMVSPQAADRLVDAGIDRRARAGEKPSDHVPVWARFTL